MNFGTYKGEAIVLSRKDFSEADRILTVYSKEFGKLSLLAKGIKRPKSRKRGNLEVFSQIKFLAAKTKGLGILVEVALIESFSYLRKDLKRMALAYYVIEVIGRITNYEERNERLYELLVKYFGKIENEEGLLKLRESFIFDLLTLLGYWPKEKTLVNSDQVLEQIIERKINSKIVGKRILT
ncbi:DNA repair protein RecO [Candidatus Woesebacteria bacterium RIFOXYB1_FULL_38_16]|uniref:DNA repair protein RecO n=1 Tax=Candidatus Woesebacteria bacterium RIFOXYB1_FULL_38_16 TaxID=1802538 RepID=A0A1F8CSM4_9BACT|nr:MAG: DNA repair protein RecO [Candidatus Woesebacteria bacterium RIFOXYA1_FULL_38_9]OGM79324.1 MAG: DNA repair protein RecO [Candidatus Woesebacteria bacterium RIFOXYB1_FULL_38_16]